MYILNVSNIKISVSRTILLYLFWVNTLNVNEAWRKNSTHICKHCLYLILLYYFHVKDGYMGTKFVANKKTAKE